MPFHGLDVRALVGQRIVRKERRGELEITAAAQVKLVRHERDRGRVPAS
jgi:hypothetical protein